MSGAVVLSDRAREVLEGVLPAFRDWEPIAEPDVPGYRELVYRLERLLEADAERRRRVRESEREA